MDEAPDAHRELLDVAVDVEAFVDDRQRLLTFGVQLALSQLVQQASFIRRLQQTRSECTMHLDSQPR